MKKTNSLKLVPYAPHFTYYYDGKSHNEPKMTGMVLQEYTYGKPGEQKTVGRSILIDWRPNEPFKATLTLNRLERGRSAARFWFRDEEGTEYPMFGQGIVDMLKAGVLDHGVITGTWIAVKRGANYGIERYET